MIRLIRGDIGRILKKPGFYVLIVIYVLICLSDAFSDNSADFEDMYFGFEFSYTYLLPFVLGIPVFLGVYTDELRVGALQTSIGRGIPRRNIVIAKFIDSLILAFFICAIEFVSEIIYMRYKYFIIPTSLQYVRWMALLLLVYIKVVGAIAFAAIFMYLTWNASIGLVVELISLTFVQIILDNIQKNTSWPVLDISYIGQAEEACMKLAAKGNFIMPLIMVLIYLTIFIAISILVFSRKELEL